MVPRRQARAAAIFARSVQTFENWTGSGYGSGRVRGRLIVESGSDIADADDPDQGVLVEHRHVPDMVPVHQVTDVLEAVVGAAGDQLLYRDQLRYLHVHAGGAVLGDGAHHVALGEHADRGVALGAHHVLDYQRADITGAQQLRGDGD